MDVNNKDKSSQVYDPEYLLSFQKLREAILLGEATWQDVIDLRYKYNMPELSKDTIRKGVLFYDEFNNAGWIHTEDQKYYSNMNQESTCYGGGGGNIYKYATDKVITEYKNGVYTSDKVVELEDGQVNDKDSLLKAHGFNSSEWILVSARTSKWQQRSKDDSVKNLYSSRISVKPREIPIDPEWYKNLLDGIALKEDRKYLENLRVPEFYSNYKHNGEILVIALDDLHWGRFAWKETVGKDNNLEIAKTRILNNISDIKNKFRDRKFEKIILKMGSDFLNSNYDGVTSLHKNPQDNDGTFKKIFSEGVELLIDIIDRFISMAPVQVIFVAGNHGEYEDYFVGKCLELYYRNIDGVEIDASSCPRKYVEFGTNLIGFMHGDKEREENIPNLMACDQPEAWGRTDEHVYIAGHLHGLKERIVDINGVTIFTVPTIVRDDEWTYSKGFYSQKKTMAFIFDREDGLIETHYFKPDKSL